MKENEYDKYFDDEIIESLGDKKEEPTKKDSRY